MAVERIQQVFRKQPVIESQVQLQEAQQRLNLFTASSFERAQSLNFSDGARVDVPFMNDQDRDLAGKLFGSVPTEKREELQTSFDALTHLIREEGANNPDGVKVGDFSSGLTRQLGQTIEVYMTTTAVEEAGDAVQAVMFGAMIGVEQELGNFAKEMQNRLNAAGEMRTDITELRDELTDWPDDGSTRTFSWTDGDGTVHENVSLTKEEAKSLVDKLDGELETMSEMTDMMRFDLQRASETYQQALNTLSSLLKSQHESLMAVIRNLKG